MKNPLRSVLITTALLTFTAISFGQGKGKPSPTPTPTPVPTPIISMQLVHCSSIVDQIERDACHASNRVQADANRLYVHGQEGVSIALDSSSAGNIVINLQDSTRSSRLDFSEVVTFGNPQPSFSGPQLVKNGYYIFGALKAKTDSPCSADPICEFDYVTNMNGGGFTINKIYYRLQWNPDSVLTYINTAQSTSKVNVHYKKDATGESFTVTPILNENGYYLAGLQSEAKGKVMPGGQYNMPFSLVVKIN